MKWTIKMPTGGEAGGLRIGALARRARSIFGFLALGLVLFLIFVWISLPTRAIAWRIGHEARARGILVDIEDVSISPFGSASLHRVTWTYEPSRPGQVPDSLYLETVEIDVSLLALLTGGMEVELETAIDDAKITAFYDKDADGAAVKVDIDDLPLYDVPKLRQAINAPVRGLFGLHVDLKIPENKFARAQGSIDISCAACEVGDGETLVFVPGVSSGILAKGVTLPKIDFGSFAGRLTVADGIASTEGIEVKSDDVLMKLTGSMTLNDPVGRSSLGFDVWVQLTESLQGRSETLKLMVQTANPNARPDPPDDAWLAFKLRGTVARPKFMGIKTKTKEEKDREKREKAREAEAKKKAKEAEKAKAKAKPKPKLDPEPEPEPEAKEPTREEPTRPEPTREEPPSTAEMPSTAEPPSTADPAGAPDPTNEAPDAAALPAAQAEAEPAAETGGEPQGGGEGAGGGEGGADTGAAGESPT